MNVINERMNGNDLSLKTMVGDIGNLMNWNKNDKPLALDIKSAKSGKSTDKSKKLKRSNSTSIKP